MTRIRRPKQARSKQTKKQIMEAAFQLFAEKGIHGTNSKEIATRADVSIGSFYAYFKNKKTLLLEMLEDYIDRHFNRIWESLDAGTADDLTHSDVRGIIQNVFSAYDISPRFHAQTHALRYSDPEINQIYAREREREITQIEFLLEANRHTLQVTDLRATAVVIHNAVENVAHTAKFIGTTIREDRLVAALTDMIYNFVNPAANP